MIRQYVCNSFSACDIAAKNAVIPSDAEGPLGITDRASSTETGSLGFRSG